MYRRQEYFDTSGLILGKNYSKKELVALGGIEPPSSNQQWAGFAEFKNCILLTINLDTTNALNPYKNHFASDDEFWMQFVKTLTDKADIVQRLQNPKEEVHLFLRQEPGRTSRFLYYGKVQHLESSQTPPIHFKWKLLEATSS